MLTTSNLQRFYDSLARKLAMEPKNLIMHGLREAVDRNETGTDINAAASAWVAAGWIAQADATEIAGLVTARDEVAEEEEES